MKNTTHTHFFLLVIGLLLSQSLSAQLRINMGNPIVDRNEEFCVDLIVEDFNDLLLIDFALEWDPNAIEYISTENLSTLGLVENVDFATNRVNEGRFSFTWLDQSLSGTSLPDGQILFSICFRAIGEGGTETRLRLTDGGALGPGIDVRNIMDESIGIGASDALIKISFEEIPDNAVFVYYDDYTFSEGESFCIPIRVRNYNDVSLLSFALIFNNNRYRFDGFMNVRNWEGSANVSFNQTVANSSGEVAYVMFDQTVEAAGFTLDDGDAIFDICFTHLMSEECVFDEIMISSNLTSIEAAISDGVGTFTETDAPVIFEPGKLKLINGSEISLDGEMVFPVTCSESDIGAIDISASGGTGTLRYNWSNGATSQDITNLAAGDYQVSISDACLAIDTLVRTITVPVSSEEAIADAGDDQTLGCSNPSIQIGGTGSSTGQGYQYDWVSIDGQSQPTDPSTIVSNLIDVSEPGRYVLTVIHTESGCSDQDTVEVFDIRPDLTSFAGDDVNFDCGQTSINLEGTGNTGVNITYEWNTSDGNIINQFSKGGVWIDRPGTYTFSVSDAAHVGCVAIDTVVVGGDNYVPITDLGSDVVLTCNDPSLMLSAIAGGSAETGVTYQWTTSSGSIVGADIGFEVMIDAPGVYMVTATTAAECTSSSTISVSDIRSTPSVFAGSDRSIDCDDEFVTLTGSGDLGAGYTAEWSTGDGSIMAVVSESEIRVTSAGTYTFTITETINGCTASSDVNVSGNNEKPQASISGDDAITCAQGELRLNANNGASAVDGYTYNWTTTDGSIDSADGSDDVWVTVNAAGTYMVEVLNTASGCSTPAVLTIRDDRMEPEISISSDMSIDCEASSGPLSVTADDPSSLNYSWRVVEGNGSITSGATSSTAEFLGSGKYEVTVIDPLTGCASIDTIEVSLSGSLPAASVGMDYDHCDTETILMGNQPGDVTGQWTVIAGSAELEDPQDRNCRVNSLNDGVNTFVWTLSTTDCPDYTSDTININLIESPMANDDVVTLLQGFGSATLNFLDNDRYNRSNGVFVNITAQPSLGSVEESSPGVFSYTLDNANAFGEFTFEYEICDEVCSLLCDTGSVAIDVRDASQPVAPERPSNDPISLGITPNGDGLNDLLVFDEIEDSSSSYNTQRLIIYNRWGDIVHEARPYQNDWGGTSKSGSMLPQGTYYFVLQLDLGKGIIIEGDVTILQ